MDNDERLAAYVAARTPEGRLAVLSEDSPLLTPKMRRRLRQKRDVSHSHATLLVLDLGGGRRKRVPCQQCHPVKKQKLIGG